MIVFVKYLSALLLATFLFFGVSWNVAEAVEVEIGRETITVLHNSVLGTSSDTKTFPAPGRNENSAPAEQVERIQISQHGDQPRITFHTTDTQYPTTLPRAVSDHTVRIMMPAETTLSSHPAYTERAERADEVSLSLNGVEKPSLKSKNARAQIDAEQIDIMPVANSISVVTPSGENKLLHHLPDQAVRLMKQTLSAKASLNPYSLNITTQESDLVFVTDVEQQKRLLGIFPRNVKTQMVFNDRTREISEQPTPDRSLPDQFLDILSF